MGKASSAKKVARAARSGGKVAGQRRSLGFPAAIVTIFVLGIGLVAFARGSQPGGGDPELGDHWHASFGIYVCDRWVQNFSDRGPDALGIHTHDDGLIHIHPFLAGAAGKSATMGKFLDQIGVKVSDDSITLPPGEPYEERTYKAGETTCGGEAATVRMGRWDNAVEALDSAPDEVVTSGIRNSHFDGDLYAYTIAFLPEGAQIPLPPTAADILSLATIDGGIDQPVTGQPDNSERPDAEDAPAAPAEGELPDDSVEVPAGDTAPAGDTEPAGDSADPANEPESTEAPSTSAGG